MCIWLSLAVGPGTRISTPSFWKQESTHFLKLFILKYSFTGNWEDIRERSTLHPLRYNGYIIHNDVKPRKLRLVCV